MRKIQGVFFNWGPLKVLETAIQLTFQFVLFLTSEEGCDWQLGSFLFGTEIGGFQQTVLSPFSISYLRKSESHSQAGSTRFHLKKDTLYIVAKVRFLEVTLIMLYLLKNIADFVKVEICCFFFFLGKN